MEEVGTANVGVGERGSRCLDVGDVLCCGGTGGSVWVMYPRIGRTLGGFHQKVDCRLLGQKTHKGMDGTWVYLLLAEAISEAGLQEVETCVDRHQNTVTQCISTRPIMDLCIANGRCPGTMM